VLEMTTTIEAIEYRVVLIAPDSRKLLVVDGGSGAHLLCLRIPTGKRPAEQLRLAIRRSWGLHVVFLDLFPSSSVSTSWAVAEVLVCDVPRVFREADLGEVGEGQLSEDEHLMLQAILNGKTASPFCRVSWIDEAIAWVEEVTKEKLASRQNIEQYNAGGPFTLIRFSMSGGRAYWLKATGGPNAHERSIVVLLSKLCPGHLPKLIAQKPAWNAWLMAGELPSVRTLPVEPTLRAQLLEGAVGAMAELQKMTTNHDADLLEAGAFDHRLSILRAASQSLFHAMEEAMCFQTSTRVPVIERRRLVDLRRIFEDTCDRMDDLGLPVMVLHGDMNLGNMLAEGDRYQFIDWSETYVGNPLIALQHLLLLSQPENQVVKETLDRAMKNKYRAMMCDVCDSAAIDQGFMDMPLIAAASTMYGRGDWLNRSLRDDPRRQTFVRTIARYMDRGAKDLASF
jgi:hypothetical protein